MAIWTSIGKTRGLCGASLLLMLGISGYIGTRERALQAVSVPVSRVSYVVEENEEDSFERASEKLRAEREREVALLQKVVEDDDIDSETRRDASSQITVLAERMELEHRLEVCLEEMGFNQTACISSANGITVICPMDCIEGDHDRLRMIDAICGLTGHDAGDIKIILSKK